MYLFGLDAEDFRDDVEVYVILIVIFKYLLVYHHSWLRYAMMLPLDCIAILYFNQLL